MRVTGYNDTSTLRFACIGGHTDFWHMFQLEKMCAALFCSGSGPLLGPIEADSFRHANSDGVQEFPFLIFVIICNAFK